MDAVARTKSEQRETERVALLQTKRAAFETVFPGVASALEAYREHDALVADMYCKLEHYGSLTDRQVKYVMSVIKRAKAKLGSTFVGEEGQRAELTITVEKIIWPEVDDQTRYARFFEPAPLHLCRDEHGNRITYRGRGAAIPGEGQTVRVVATIKRHTTYSGENQTEIARPKLVRTEESNGTAEAA